MVDFMTGGQVVVEEKAEVQPTVVAQAEVVEVEESYGMMAAKLSMMAAVTGAGAFMYMKNKAN